jgi:excisionase family DNA binding protein
VTDQDILTCATQAAEWLFDRRERLETHEHEMLTLLWLSVSEIETIIDSFGALEAVTASRSTSAWCATTSSTGSEDAVSGKARDARRVVRPPADADTLLSPDTVAWRCGLSRSAVCRAIERGELRASRLRTRSRIRAASTEVWVDETEAVQRAVLAR